MWTQPRSRAFPTHIIGKNPGNEVDVDVVRQNSRIYTLRMIVNVPNTV